VPNGEPGAMPTGGHPHDAWRSSAPPVGRSNASGKRCAHPAGSAGPPPPRSDPLRDRLKSPARAVEHRRCSTEYARCIATSSKRSPSPTATAYPSANRSRTGHFPPLPNPQQPAASAEWIRCRGKARRPKDRMLPLANFLQQCQSGGAF
jgi:hypothetical protein